MMDGGNESRIHPVTREQVIEEYTVSSSAATPHERAKWGSEESMLNRFRFALRLLDTLDIHTWLDIGCGEGDFFALAEEQGRRLEVLHGLDITPAMIERAEAKTYASPATFSVGDLHEAGSLPGAPFDLVTLIGVLQQCGEAPEEVFRAVVGAVKPGGRLFLTTKHLGWEEFRSGRLQPESNHSWFRLRELLVAAENAGLRVLRSGGFLPKEDREVPPGQSHTVYLLAVRMG